VDEERTTEQVEKRQVLLTIKSEKRFALVNQRLEPLGAPAEP